jgi:hypothetical protein
MSDKELNTPMNDKELNKPMNHEQLSTPRALTAEELDMVSGGWQEEERLFKRKHLLDFLEDELKKV